MVKITDRLQKIRGVNKCRFNLGDKRITCTIDEKNKETTKLRIVKTVSDLQLQDSIINFKFIVIKSKKRKTSKTRRRKR